MRASRALTAALPFLFLAVSAARTAAQITGASAPPPEMTAPVARALTPFEEFTGKLKLDAKQDAAAEEIFNAAARDAAPVGTELLQIRQQLLNAVLTGTPEDVKAASDAYATAEAKMAAIEASAFAKVYALLKPNQQSNAPQAFALMAGFFQPKGGVRSTRGGRQ